MGIRFRKRIKIAPGVKVNIGKKGLSSVSIGGKGLTLNAGGKRGASVTTSIPGTGLSANHKLTSGSPSRTSETAPDTANSRVGSILIAGIVVVVLAIMLFG